MARAESPASTDEQAMELFERAAERFRQGEFRQALDLLDEADRLKPSAILHYNKARAHEGLGDKRAAVAEYRKYLQMDPAARDVGAVERRISVLEAEIEADDQRDAQARRRSNVPAPAPPGPRPVIAPWIVTAVGGVSLGFGTYFGLAANRAEERANDASSQVEARDAYNEANDAAIAANIGLILGGVLVVGGVIWGLLELSSHGTAGAAIP